jgi:hypothetical protein
MCTILAARDMASESCSATALDGRHDLQLLEAHMTGIGFAPGRSVLAQDVRDLQRWTRHNSRASGGRLGLAMRRHARSLVFTLCLMDFPDVSSQERRGTWTM